MANEEFKGFDGRIVSKILVLFREDFSPAIINDEKIYAKLFEVWLKNLPSRRIEEKRLNGIGHIKLNASKK